MEDVFKIVKEGLQIILVLGIMLATLTISFVIGLNIREKGIIQAEWNSKVNNCVMNPNCRKDCKLILYKEQQSMNYVNRQQTIFMPIPVMSGR